MMDLSLIIFLFAVIFLAGMIQGLAGFAFGLVAAPIMVIFLPPKIVVPIIIIYAIIINAMVLFRAYKWLELMRIRPLIVGGIIGIPFGTYLLLALDADLLKIFIGLIIVLFAIALLKGLKIRIKKERLAFIITGLISGLLSGSTSIGGPPVALFLTNQNVKKHSFRANSVAYFLVLDISLILAFIITNIINTEVINYVLWFLPAVILGTALGIKLSHKIEEKLFRKIILILIIISGLMALASGLGVF